MTPKGVNKINTTLLSKTVNQGHCYGSLLFLSVDNSGSSWSPSGMHAYFYCLRASVSAIVHWRVGNNDFMLFARGCHQLSQVNPYAADRFRLRAFPMC